MIIIHHRINTIDQLHQVPRSRGVEVDLRTWKSDIIVTHDLYVNSVMFEDWIRHYKHRVLILNVKEEGIEDKILELLRNHGVGNFFFLDQSFPFLVRLLRNGDRRTALRVSDFESAETAIRMPYRPEWIWVDCFTGDWSFAPKCLPHLHNLGFKCCLVAPELHGRSDPTEVTTLRSLVSTHRHLFQAICTKRPDQWADFE